MKNGASTAQQCQASSTEYVIQKPCAGSNIMVDISKDEPTSFNFAVEDIRAMKLLVDGGMMISFVDGSTLTVKNFEAARASYPFTDITMNDGTVVNLQKLANGLASTLPHDTVADLTILKPVGGIGATDMAFNLQEGKNYKLGFSMKDVASVENKDGNLLITFKDGTHLTLNNYNDVNTGTLPPQMTLADGSVIPAAHLINVLNVAAAEQVKTVEPAAGDAKHEPHHVAHKQQPVEKVASAQDLANIEPAAGANGAAGPIGGGYGFNSSVDPAGILGINALGPIGPTALAFGLPTLEQFQPLVSTPAATPTPFGPPTLTAVDRWTFEDTPVNLQIGASQVGSNPQSLTITVGNIPTGWGVDIGLSGGGTYNPAAHTWTITLPAGTAFAGGPVLIPPHDSDADIKLPTHPPLSITVTSTDTVTGAISTSTTNMNVVVDAVADQPDLAVQSVAGSDNVPLPLHIHAAVTDTDGSESLTTATLTGIPAGFTLNHGTLSNGVWTLDANDLSTLTLTAPRGYNGSFVVTVRVNNAETHLTDQEITLANNTNFNQQSFQVTFNDTVPIVGDSVATVDETNLTGGPNVVTGAVIINYQEDGPGTFGATSFTSGGSELGGKLTSHGLPVTVTLAGNVYTAKDSNGTTVFTMVVNTDGTYTFTQFHALDHADANNPNDSITLNFTVTATDSDGSTTTGHITVNVLDDAPIARDDTVATGNSVSGDVTSNDTLSQDGPNLITKIVLNGVTTAIPQDGTNVTIIGQYGTLVINNTGAYTYTSKNVGVGTDNFQYTIRDYDGDTSTAVLHASINHVNSFPVIGNSAVTVDETNLATGPNVISGTVPADFFGDGPGTIAPTSTFSVGGSLTDGKLSSHGSPVSVTLSGNTYTGKDALNNTVFTLVVNTNGTYTFTQFHQLDHADGNNPNDAINLNFTVVGTDKDGDTGTGVITVTVLDDAPIAINDSFLSSTGTATGNVMANDIVGADSPGRVYDVTFGGVTKLLPADGSNVTFTGANGTLVINSTGQFTYTPPVPGNGTTFTYRLIDFDGDKSVVDANHGTVTVDTNGVPTITGSTVTVEEMNLVNGVQTVNGTYSFNYGGDGQGTTGTIANTGYTGPALTSHGVAVMITLSGNTYTGTANGQTVFTMSVNKDGSYSFSQFKPLDHPNSNDPHDTLNLTFGIRITDADGDAANAQLTAVVVDDGPIAVNDNFVSSGATVSGNIVANDHVGADTPGRVYDVTFGGQTVTLNPDGSNTTITNAAGTLVINTSGQFTFTPPLPGNGTTFSYRLIDFDGDKSIVDANHGQVTVDTNGIPVIGDSTINTDETSLVLGPNVSEGYVSAEYFGDGPGVITPINGSFGSSGSLLGGQLSSHGSPITVTLLGNTFTGKDASGVTVFTLLIRTDGTYTFTQFKALDHADGNDPNDIITLKFGVIGTDKDGDTDTGVITVNVRDDAPVALNDTISMMPNQTIATGNVLTNDTLGQDLPVPVVSVTYNGNTYNVPTNGTNLTIVGAHGTLVINNTGAYTYTSTNKTQGTDNFKYTIRDYDGDSSSATLGITVTHVNSVPVVENSAISVDETNLATGPITMNGTINANYFGDGPGAISATNTFSSTGSKLGGALTSHGSPVTVTLSGSTYTGKDALGNVIFTLVVAANGSYTFTQFHALDHADPNNPNDIINLNFSVVATDADGDTATGVITVNVLDDAPIAVNDSFLSSTGTATGNILANDIVGADAPGHVYDVTFGGQTVILKTDGSNSTITNAAGTLVINNTGQFTYTPPLPGNGTTFTYRIVDYDGDKSIVDANHGQVVVDTNGVPTVTNTSVTIYESGSHTVNGIVTADFFGDGPGTFLVCAGNNFAAGGSLKGGALSSGGYAVTVTSTATGYVGTANGATVFNLVLNSNGTYTFTQYKGLDHADGTNPADIISLSFQVCAKDADGDVGHGTLVVNVVDSAPVANNDITVFCAADMAHNGNLISGYHNTNGGADSLSFDGPNWISSISGAGGTTTIPQNGAGVIKGEYGTLYVFNNGSYIYNQTVAGEHTEHFTYYLQDGDGDTSAANLTLIGVPSYINESWIISDGTTYGTSKGDMMVAYKGGVSATMYGGAGDDALLGWTGHDYLYGGAGNDVLIGGFGADHYWGGAGADIFVADRSDITGPVKYYDTVHDFNTTEGDVIDLTQLIDNGSAAQASINSYVQAVAFNGGTMLQINNHDGKGWQNGMFIENHTTLNVEDLLNHGNLSV